MSFVLNVKVGSFFEKSFHVSSVACRKFVFLCEDVDIIFPVSTNLNLEMLITQLLNSLTPQKISTHSLSKKISQKSLGNRKLCKTCKCRQYKCNMHENESHKI